MKQKFINQVLDEKKIRRKKDMQLAQLKASCDHKKDKNGKEVSTLKPISDDGMVFRCKICDEVIDLHEIDMEEIRKAAKTIKNVIEAIKVAEDDISDDILLQFGITKLLLSRLDKYYKDLVLDRMQEDDFNDHVDFNNPIQNMMMNGGNPMFQMVNDPEQYLAGIYGGGYNKKKNKKKNNKNKKKRYSHYDFY